MTNKIIHIPIYVLFSTLLFVVVIPIVGCVPTKNITTGWDNNLVMVPSKGFEKGLFLKKIDENSGMVPGQIALFDSNYVIFRTSLKEEKWPINPSSYESALWTTHGQYVFSDSLLIIQALAAVIHPYKKLNMVSRYILKMKPDSTFCLFYGRVGFYRYDEHIGEVYDVLSYQADSIRYNQYDRFINLKYDKSDSLSQFYSDTCQYLYKITTDSIPSSVLKVGKGQWARSLPKSAL